MASMNVKIDLDLSGSPGLTRSSPPSPSLQGGIRGMKIVLATFRADEPWYAEQGQGSDKIAPSVECVMPDPGEYFESDEYCALLKNLYNYFLNMGTERVKNACKACRIGRTANKDVLVLRCTLYVVEVSQDVRQGSVQKVVTYNPTCAGFSDFSKCTAKKWVESVPDVPSMKELCDWYNEPVLKRLRK